MGRTAIKLFGCVATVPLAMVLTRVTGSGYFMGLWLIAFPLLVLYLMDYSQELREVPNPSPLLRAFAFLMSIPQAIFGLTTLCFGVVLICWVLYNSFVERRPEYSGGFLTFGLGPLCIVFGGGWLVGAFRKNRGNGVQIQPATATQLRRGIDG